MQLNLPSFDIQVRPPQRRGARPQVFDRLRRRFVALTPEEWVRQHFVNFIIEQRQYPESLIANEIGITLNNTRRRCDTVVYDRFAHPAAIIEYKAPDIAITRRVFDQVVRYNMVLRVPMLIVSNGITHVCARLSYPDDNPETPPEYSFLPEIPFYDDIFK